MTKDFDCRQPPMGSKVEYLIVNSAEELRPDGEKLSHLLTRISADRGYEVIAAAPANGGGADYLMMRRVSDAPAEAPPAPPYPPQIDEPIGAAGRMWPFWFIFVAGFLAGTVILTEIIVRLVH